MVAYFCHHLPGIYVDMSDPYVDLSDHHVDLSDHYVDLSERNNLVGYIVFIACESVFCHLLVNSISDKSISLSDKKTQFSDK